jgi:hypothetical protein
MPLFFPLIDDDGTSWKLKEAKQFLRDPSNPPRLSPKPLDFEPDETEVNLLRLIANPNIDPYAEELAFALQLHLEVVKSHLQILVESDYITEHYDTYKPIPEFYSLKPKGRDYLIKNSLIN